MSIYYENRIQTIAVTGFKTNLLGSKGITLDPCEARAFTSDEGATFTTVNQPQRRLAGVAKPTEPASRLIAFAQLDTDFPLMPEAVGFGRVQAVHTPAFLLYSTNLRSNS